MKLSKIKFEFEISSYLMWCKERRLYPKNANNLHSFINDILCIE
jgi:hypothetical protein